MLSKRPTWDDYFMELAEMASTRSTCDRKAVGAVIVRDNRVLTTGYNGSIKGTPHCNEAGHMIENNHCVRTIHAEVNAIISAARHGVSVEGASLYVNTFPCWNCFKVLANAGIQKIFYRDPYNMDQRVIDTANELNIPLIEVKRNQ